METARAINTARNDEAYKVGDLVRIVALHIGLRDAPRETLELFNRAALRPLRVDAIDSAGSDRWLELTVMDDGRQAPDGGLHTLCVLPEEVERADTEDAWLNS